MEVISAEAGDARAPGPQTLPIGGLNVSTTAFFFDLDGTLADIVTDPQRAAVRPGTLAALARLRTLAGGAVAIISGRSVSQIDTLLQPFRFPAAGVHGLERRTAGGDVHRASIDADRHRRLAGLVDAFVASRPGLIAERKPGSIALHYRQRPELQSDCLALAESLAERHGPVQLLRGKMVVELTMAFRSKGTAIEDFMNEAPFEGRRPWFAGDDVTDETGFAAVNAMDGISVKVGEGETSARYRVDNVDAIALHLKALSVDR